MELVIKYIDKRIREILISNNSKIALIGYVGSLSPKKISGDIDIFCFLNENEPNNASDSISKHKELNLSFSLIQNELFDKNVNLSVFTEFRLEEHSRYLAKKKMSSPDYLLHLKVYPTINSVLDWQQKAIAYNYFNSISKIIYSSVDHTKMIEHLRLKIPKPTISEKIDFLRMLVYEMNDYLFLGNLPSSFVELEMKNKSIYISNYLSVFISEYLKNMHQPPIIRTDLVYNYTNYYYSFYLC